MSDAVQLFAVIYRKTISHLGVRCLHKVRTDFLNDHVLRTLSAEILKLLSCHWWAKPLVECQGFLFLFLLFPLAI